MEELYEKLLEYYLTIYGKGKDYLEKDITNIMSSKGVTREEAIRLLYIKFFGEIAKEREERKKILKPRLSLLDLISYAYNGYSHNFSLAVSVFLREAARYILLSMWFFLLLIIIGLYGQYITSLSHTEIIKLIRIIFSYPILAILIVSIYAFIPLITIVDTTYWCVMANCSYKVMKGFKITWYDIVDSFRYFKKLFKAKLLVNTLTYAPLMTALSIFYLFIARMFHNIFLQSSKGFEQYFSTGLNIVLVLLIACIIVTIVLYIISVYVPYEVIIGNMRPVSALKSSFAKVKASIKNVLVYFILSVLIILGATFLSSVFSSINISIQTLITFLINVFLLPIIDLSLTGVYIQLRKEQLNLWPKSKSFKSITIGNLRKGFKELKVFLTKRDRLTFLGIALIIFLICYVIGLCLGLTSLRVFANLIVHPGRLNPLLTRVLPLSLVLEIFFNNWEISITASVGGLILITPILVTMVNGIFIGIVASKLKLLEFLVLIMPHGSIELPSFIIALAAGFRLMYYKLKKFERIDKIFRETVFVALGLVPLFLIAAMIEVFITPNLARLILRWH